MGRWVHFSTGFEYKFWFGIQTSDDITRFGGKELYSHADHSSYFVWDTQSDPWDRLVGFGYVRADLLHQWVHSFPKTFKGTESLHLKFDTWSEIQQLSGEKKARLLLGLVIYHQLLYTGRLYALFEV